MQYSFTIEKHIDNDLVDQVIDSAGYSIAYWATAATIDSEAELYAIQWDGTDFEDTSRNSVGIRAVSYEDIARAIGNIASMKVEVAGWLYDQLHQWLNGEPSMDGDLADVIIQVALFGEIVYG